MPTFGPPGSSFSFTYPPLYPFSPPPPTSNRDGSGLAETTTIVVAFVISGAVIVGVILFLIIRGQRCCQDESSNPPEQGKKPVTDDTFLADIIEEKLVKYSSQRLKIITNNFNNVLGKGAFGVVYKGTLENGVPVAVKVLIQNCLDKLMKQQFVAEVNSIGRTRHFNLVRLYGFCFDEDYRVLVYEFMENGSLAGFLFDEHQRNAIQWERLHDIAIGTSSGLAYLHEYFHDKIIHYDIKPENILLDRNLSPKVADFGLAKLCQRDATHVTLTAFKGTPGYIAPELWMRDPITPKADVYSFGIVLFEIVGRRRSFNRNLPDGQEWFPKWVWKKFEKGELGELMVDLGIEENDREKAKRMAMVALWCIQHQPERRPVMSNVVKLLESEMMVSQPPDPFPPHYPFQNEFLEFQTSSSEASSSSSFGITTWKTAVSRLIT